MKKRICVLLGILLLMSVVVLPSSASNATPISGIRQMAGPPQNREWWPVGKNKCFVKVDLTYEYTGDIVGMSTNHFTILSHGPCEENGPVPYKYRENLRAWGTFTGEVAGVSGSFDFLEIGKVEPVDLGQVAYTGRVHVRSGTDQLEGLKGQLDVSYIKGASATDVQGWVRFGDDDD
jgi:hypothetical protein